MEIKKHKDPQSQSKIMRNYLNFITQIIVEKLNSSFSTFFHWENTINRAREFMLKSLLHKLI